MRVEDTTMRTIEWALTAESERQRVSAHNIANINTPGFRSSRIEFESSLADALRNGGSGVAMRTSRAAGTPTNLNGNDVLLEEETILLNKSALHYEALSTAMSMKFSSLRASIGR